MTGDGGDNVIAIARGDNGVLLVNGGAVAISGGTPSIRNTSLIRIAAQGGDDQVNLEEGSGLPNAEVPGGDGVDSIVVNGANLNEVFAMAPNAGRVRLERTSPAPFSVDLDSLEAVTLNMNAGDDTFNGSIGVAALVQKVTIDAGAGNDTINGTDVAETLIGGDGNDTIDGNRGNDVALMGPGDDTFIWDPGDGNDVEEGQDGLDRLVFNGANGADAADVSANGGRVRFFRRPGNVTMDLNDVEAIDFNALAGADTVVVNDLSGTDMQDVNVELAATLGGFAADGAADAITVNGTAGDDAISVARTNGNVVVSGLPARVSIGRQRRRARHAHREWPGRQRHARRKRPTRREDRSHVQSLVQRVTRTHPELPLSS